jgi:uncharacterized SAM-binding protein YcdF (DUF218 family)
MNDLLVAIDLGPMRPLLGALVMPPVPFVLVTLAGALLMGRRRRPAWLLVGLGLLGIWFSATGVGADLLRRWLLPPVSALTPGEVRALRHAPGTAIVVLGGGAKPLAAEYGVPDLNALSVDRLRYASWLARETGLPMLFSGGRSHGARSRDVVEAQIAALVAERDFRMPLRWQETGSRDTRENAIRSVALLHTQGIERIVLVTHAYHMPRAQHNFERAVQAAKLPMRIVAAPMDVRRDQPPSLYDFVPSRTGFHDMRLILHEWIGRAIGA